MSSVDSLPNEARLLLECARLELDAGARERIAAVFAQGFDAQRLYGHAEQHSLRPLLFRHLGEGSFGPLPRELETRLWQHSEQLRRRNAVLEAELLAVIAMLQQAGIASAPHKGPVLARLAYGDAALREYGDLDLLIPLADMPRARVLLERRGFAPKYPLAPAAEQAFLQARAQYHMMLVQHGNGLLLELHWKTDSEFAVEDTADAAWWESTDTLNINGVAVKCLPREAMLLALLLHGSKHYWDSLHWLVDVAELARRSPGLDWQRVVHQAEDLQARRRLALGLLLLRRWREVEFPAAIGRWLDQEADMAALADDIARRWFEAAPALSPWQRLRVDSRLYDTPAQRRRHAADTLLHPGLPEWSATPLPRGLSFLYLPLRALRLAGRQLRRIAGC